MPRRRPDRPIKSVELKITFRADGELSKRVREAVPSARVRSGICEVRVTADEPRDVAEKAKEILEILKAAGTTH